MTSSTRWSGWAVLVGACTWVACAASPKAEMQPGVPGSPIPAAPAATFAPEPEPRTVAEAEALLEKARADLDRLALNAPPRSAAGASTPAPAPASPESPASQESRAEGADAEPATKADGPCPSACRAFSSLSRASDAVCRLDAEGGKRCERARQIRDDAAHRIAGCGCVQ